MDLRTLLTTLVASGIGGTAAYWLLEKWAWFAGLTAEYKRFAALALNALVAILAYLAMLGMGYQTPPADWRAWIETIANVVIALGATTFAVSQVWHGARDLSKSPPA